LLLRIGIANFLPFFFLLNILFSNDIIKLTGFIKLIQINYLNVIYIFKKIFICFNIFYKKLILQYIVSHNFPEATTPHQQVWTGWIKVAPHRIMKQIISSFCIPQHLKWLTHSILDLTDGSSSLLGYSGICHKHSKEKHQQLCVQILGKMVFTLRIKLKFIACKT
jgi:hypothetical protein